MDCEAIELELGDDHVATITLNRPEAHNAWNDQMARETSWAWETIRDDDDVHAVVMRANGDKAFCTGADVPGGTTWFFSTTIWNTFDPGRTLSPNLPQRRWKPMWVAVHGRYDGGRADARRGGKKGVNRGSSR